MAILELGNKEIKGALMVQGFIGIDPGKDGAMAILINEKILVYDFDDEKGVKKLKELNKKGVELFAVIEKVNAMPKQGRSSIFKFGTNFGIWQGRLEILGVRMALISPQKWQNDMYDYKPNKPPLPKRYDHSKLSDKDFKKLQTKISNERKNIAKNFSLEFARREFPQAKQFLLRKKDHNRAEALIIAGYCKKLRRKTYDPLDCLY
jgi:hypothetical protein